MNSSQDTSIDTSITGLMVVDDDEDILFTVYSLFKKRPFPILLAHSGQECLNYLQKGFKGVILMDIMMPGLDGWETIQEIVNRDMMHDLIISMFTAKDVPDTSLDHLKEYVFDYITKPFEPENLIALVDDYLTMLN
ncbi:response regulator [Methanospirillum sp. J.3.6.1-F.2.7.3]|jgi:CheY-like chemotaxis protein|uniref:Response regulator n=2 Tax=Methanospirillum TaxID=2202 RepID=A0A8E7AUG8_9EURY|nr:MULTISPECIES: response regulator [Methanospirillum]MDX8550140.1 response regulator [Methanospirillum hungatei]QVV87500.1 response regulator [Methanospirillum sp. J.3.6.1-F.2.7.3]QXO94965.1 response regulator [Methanospirillum hungatei]